MDQVKVTTLVAVIDEGSFDAAAARLGITPSAVSQRIKSLENQLGRMLLKRSTPLAATEAGEILIQAGRRMALLDAETTAQLRERVGHVPLTVAINADSLATWFRPVFWQVARWPEVSLQLRIEDEAHSLGLLRRGDVLGAITREPRPVTGCEATYLGSMRYRAVASPRLLDQHTKVDGQIDWVAMPALRFGPNDELQQRDLDGRVPEGDHIAERHISWIPSSEAFVEAACAGLGWALLPEAQINDPLSRGELVYLDDRTNDVDLYWHSWRLESVVLERLSIAVRQAACALHSPLVRDSES